MAKNKHKLNQSNLNHNLQNKDISNKIVVIVLILVILASVISLAIYFSLLNKGGSASEETNEGALIPAGDPYEPQPATSGSQVSLTIISPEKNNEGVK